MATAVAVERRYRSRGLGAGMCWDVPREGVASKAERASLLLRAMGVDALSVGEKWGIDFQDVRGWVVGGEKVNASAEGAAIREAGRTGGREG